MKSLLNKLSKILICILLAFSVFVPLTSCSDKGESAYEIAVRNGFSGSEAEWLESLKGSDGINGVDGNDAPKQSLKDIYNECVENGYTGTFMDFVENYFSNSSTLQYQMNESLLTSVSITSTWTYTQLGMTGSSEKETSANGSGVICDINNECGDAYIITNFHVVYSPLQTENNGISKNIKCFLYGMEYESQAIAATCIGYTSTYDLAILEIKNSDILKNSLSKAVIMGEESEVFIGMNAYVVGNSGGKGISMALGSVTHLNEISRYTISTSIIPSIRCFRIDATVNGGNSGGGVYNSRGELIGIVCSKNESSGVEGMGYAIPITVVKNITKKIIYNYQNGIEKLEKGLVGCNVGVKEGYTYYDTDIQAYKTIQVCRVTSINEGSAGEAAGLKVDDKLISATLNDITVNVQTIYSISDLLILANKGDTLKLSIIRTEDGVDKELVIDVVFKNLTELE